MKCASLVIALWLPSLAHAQYSGEKDQESFLSTARVVETKVLATGVTQSIRAILTDGRVTHEAHIQNVHRKMPVLLAPDEVPVEWVDCYRYNIAAYRLDRLLGLGMVPVSVERPFQGKPAAFTWWVDDVLMLEHDRLLSKTAPPDEASWNSQIADANVFDQLIFNTDRNYGNTVITKAWKVALIDHTRAFPKKPVLREPSKLTTCSAGLRRGLEKLSKSGLEQTMRGVLSNEEMNALLARRDLLLKHFAATPPLH